jgi:hypothetical protein
VCEMGEGVRGIYRAKKQWMSSPKSVCPCTIHKSRKAASYVQVLSSC